MEKIKQNILQLLVITAIAFNSMLLQAEGFIENKGQWKSAVLFKTDIPGGTIFLEKTGITFLYYDGDALSEAHHSGKKTTIKMHCIKSEFVDANPNAVIVKEDPSTAYYNYFYGNDPSKWVSEAKAWKKLTYLEIYPKVDLEIIFLNGSLKYNFIVKPGGDLNKPKVKYSGANSIKIKDSGLEIETSLGRITELPPVVYQNIEGESEKIAAHFVLNDNILSFHIAGKFQKKHNLIIDPILIFSTYSGSYSDNFGFTATYDNLGNGYAGGTVYGKNFPTTAGAFQDTFGGGVEERPAIGYIQRDCGILKFSADGQNLLYSTFLGGSHNEQPHSMVVNSNRELIVMGSTRSSNCPHTRFEGINPSINDLYKIFVTRFNTNGTNILSSVLFSASNHCGINGDRVKFEPSSYPLLNNYADDFRGEVIVDEDDNVYFASTVMATDFPTKNAFQPNFGGGGQDGVVAKLNNDLSQIIWCSYAGGNIYDACYSIAKSPVDNNIYVTGGTNSFSMPFTLSGYQKSLNGNNPDAFVLRINGDNGSLLNSSYLGTSAYDQAYFIKSDKMGYPWLYGQTKGNFTVVGEVYKNDGASQFITKMTKNLDGIILSTVFGSGRNIPDLSPTAFMIDECDKIYIAGWGGNVNSGLGFNGGSTQGMPLTNDAMQKQTDGSDFYIAVFKPNMKDLYFASYFGGISNHTGRAEEHVDGGTSRFDEKGLIYHSVCAGCGGNSRFPTTLNAWSQTNNSSNCNNAIFKIDLATGNKKPIVQDTVFTVQVKDQLTFEYMGYDPDEGDSLFFTFWGNQLNGGSGPIPHISYFYTPDIDSIKAFFNWTPNCNHLTGDTIVINVRIRDKGCPTQDTTYAQIKILVTPPPLANGPDFYCLDFRLDGDNFIRWDAFIPNDFFKKYYLLRENPNGSISLVGTFDNGKAQSIIEDPSIDIRNQNYCYFFVSENICGMLDTLKFRICSKTEFEQPITGTDIIKATVPDNQNVEIHWTKSIEPDFYFYRLLKGINSDSSEMQFKELAIIQNINDTVYLDETVNVAEESYCYCLMVYDQCGHVSDTSNIGCNIVLNGSSHKWYFDLTWNPYKDWSTGVHEYRLERKVDTGSLRPIVALEPITLKYIDDDLDYWWGGYYFKVIAEKNQFKAENNIESHSNIIYLIQPPLLHVPSAFTPDGNNINDIWGYMPVFVKDFNMKVFNRWGEKVFETDYKGEQWDGSYLSIEPFENVFIWIATYTGWDNNRYHQKGTVTILK
jgi:gliding motility-associated-like protein